MTTPVASSFEWIDGPAARVLRASPLDGISHLFTTRALSDPATPAHVDWARVGDALGVPADRVVRVKQVHGRVVLVVTPEVQFTEAPEADAMVCRDPSRAVAVRVADCVPI